MYVEEKTVCTGLGTIHVSATTAGLGAPPRPRIGEVYSTRSLSVLRTVKLPGGGHRWAGSLPHSFQALREGVARSLGIPKKESWEKSLSTEGCSGDKQDSLRLGCSSNTELGWGALQPLP